MIAQNQVEHKTGSTTASIPFMVTNVNKRRLQRLGYRIDEIKDLNTRPAEALEILAPPDSWDRLLAHLGRGGSFSLWTFKDRNDGWQESPAHAWPIGRPRPLPADTDVYFTVNPLKERRRGVERTAALNCLYADFDVKDFPQGRPAILQHLETLPVYPSAIIDSGGGYHCYWLLQDPFPLDSPEAREVAKDTQARWVELVGADRGSKDIAHVLRVPGTLNGKYDPARPVRIDYANVQQQYLFGELYAMLPAGDPEPEPQQQETPTEKGEWDNLDLWERAMRADAMDYSMPSWADSTVIEYLQRTPRFARLWAGDLSDYRKANGDVDHSAADMALVNDLNYGTRGDEAQSWRLFSSWVGFGTDKHKRADYWPRTWARASGRHVYRPYIRPGQQQQRGDGSDLDAELAKYRRTDLGNAERLARRFGDQLRYVTEWGWLGYDGAKWEQAEAHAQQAAKETVRAIYRETATLTDAEARTQLAKWGASSENNTRINAMLTRAQFEPAIYAQTEDFDNAAMLLNLPNGTLDLHTNELRPHDPADMLTKTAGAIYDPDATCPRWESFLDEIMTGNGDLISFIQRAAGYSLTGSTEEQCLFFLYGTGDNGKSTFSEVMLALMGDYSMKTQSETLLAKHNDNGLNNDVAALAGARLVVAAETPQGRRLNENLIKDLTGGDQITARFLRKEFFSFTPVFKLWMYGNHKPTIRGTDHGIWRRLRLIPFTVQIPEDQKDRQLKHKLFAELSGILNWALEGLRSWQEKGLQPPQEVKDATSGYRAEMDVLQAFIDDCCFTSPNVWAKFGDLYEAYERWGGDSVSKRAFGMQLTERGFAGDNGTGNVAIRRGIALLASQDDDALVTPVNN